MESPRTKAKCALKQRKKSLLLQQLDIRPCPGHPAQPPEIRPPSQNASGSDPDSSDIRPRTLDIQLLSKPRTFGPQPGHPTPARAQPGQRPMYPLLTYPFVALDYIYFSTSF